MVYFVILIVGLLLLIYGADKFVHNSSLLAKKFGIPSLIIGLTVVAFGTSAPELAVSISAALSGKNEIAISNILGSSIFNLLVIVGLSGIITDVVVEKELLKRDWVAVIIGTTALFLLSMINLDVSRFDAIVLLLGFMYIFYLQIKPYIKNKSELVEEKPAEDKKDGNENLLIIIFGIIFGLILIVVGGQVSVNSASQIAMLLGLSETIIGLTVVAIGTSLPELMTSIVAAKQGEKSIAIGNVIGSNLFNILLILGTSTLISPIPVEIVAIYDILFLLIITIIMYILAKKEKLNRLWCSLLLTTYVLYTIAIIIR